MIDSLTREENELALMLLQGYNYKEISAFLGISYDIYIKTKKNIFKKLHITKTIQLLPVLIILEKNILF